MLLGGGYEGEIYPINPGYKEYRGLKFFSTPSDLPKTPDHTVIAVSNSKIEKALFDVLRAGTRAVTIFGNAETKNNEARLKDMAREANVPICGSNSMGFHNLHRKIRITPFPIPLNLKAGSIAAIIQSGSVLGALANNDKRLQFSMLVSSGAEIVTTASDYLSWSVDQPETNVVGMFLEGVRNPDGFVSALDKAASKDIPVVILKVGRSEKSAEMALSHTGAIVGNHTIFSAVAEEHGAHLVHSIDELAATLQAFSQNRRPTADGIASIHDSGGERELMADIAADLKVPYAKLSDVTLLNIGKLLESPLEADNPLDAWGSGHGAEIIFKKSFLEMILDPSVGIGLYVMDWREGYYLHEMHEKILYELIDKTTKPIIAASNYALTTNQLLAERMAEHGIPLIDGTHEALIAVKNLLKHGKNLKDKTTHTPNLKITKITKILANETRPRDDLCFSILNIYGITSSKFHVADSLNEALKAAEKIGYPIVLIGYPIVLKALANNLYHKTELNAVKINLKQSNDLTLAYKDFENRFGRNVLVAEMISGGSEWALGMINDPNFGPAVMISPGGILIDLIGEKLIMMAPFTAEETLKRLSKLKSFSLLNGYRGTTVLAVKQFAKTAAAFSRFVWDFRDSLQEADLNPIIVTKTTATAVDVLIIGK